jgi:hypothetical protein
LEVLRELSEGLPSTPSECSMCWSTTPAACAATPTSRRPPGICRFGPSIRFCTARRWRSTSPAPFSCRDTVAPYFIERGYGKIINLTTSLRNFYSVGQSPYGVTKAAIDSSTYIWARDLEGKGVTVNALLPGGACDNGDVNRPPEPGRKLLPADIMNPLLVWMCSARSDGATGTRFVGALWDNSLIAVTRTMKPPGGLVVEVLDGRMGRGL